MSLREEEQHKSETKMRLRNTSETSGSSLSATSKNCADGTNSDNEVSSQGTDDSLHDFKSPKICPKNSRNDDILSRKERSLKNPQSNLTRGKTKKRKTEVKQQSIQTFMKGQNDNDRFVCPLCLEVFNDTNSLIHIKNCAIKNNVSPTKLMSAIQLQEKQLEERKALGLPAGPFQKLNTKKSHYIRSSVVADRDLDLDMALALSMSLQEAEKNEEFEEGVAAVANFDPKFLEMNLGQRSSTLKTFGFFTNRPATEPTVKVRRKKLTGPTVLQTRTQEQRERILTERIADILVGSESITQQQSANNKCKVQKTPVIHSESLKKWHNPSAELWTRSTCSKNNTFYYVENLHECISPTEVLEDINFSIEKDIIIIDDDEDIDAMPSAVEDQDKADNSEEGMLNVSDEDENNELERINSRIVEEEDHDEGSLVNDWRKMTNNNYLSDIAIFVEDGSFIYAHSLVIATRCRSITKDYEEYKASECGTIKYKLNWSHIDRSSALIFVEYLYCGEFPPTMEVDANMLKKIKLLGEKYKMKNLQKYIENYKTVQNTQEIDNESLIQDFAEPAAIECKRTEKTEQSRLSNASPDLFESFENSLQMSIQESPLRSPINQLNKSISEPLLNVASKPKSDLSIFIAKINRQQARDIMDSDTDGDTPLKSTQIVRKNPFKIKTKNDDSYDSIRDKIDKPLLEDRKNEKTPLSKFEDEIRALGLQRISSVESEMETEVFDSPAGSLDESLYSRYKKSKGSADNSIVKYRKALQLDRENLSQADEGSDRENNEENLDIEFPTFTQFPSNNSHDNDRNVDKSVINKTDLFGSDIEVFDLTDLPDEKSPENIDQGDESRTDGIKQNDSIAGTIAPKNTSVSNFTNISENLNFDTWHEISDHSPLTQSEIRSNSVSQPLEADDIRENLTSPNNRLSQKNRTPSPIIVSSTDDELSNLNSHNDNFEDWPPPSPLPDDMRLSQLSQISEDQTDKSRNITRRRYENVHSISDNSDNEREAVALMNGPVQEHITTPKRPLKRPKTAQSFRISHNVTPPIDYERVTSPEVIYQLNKYGLKQQKRARAVQLLKHIYNELHPHVPMDSIPAGDVNFIDREAEEPPCKKQHIINQEENFSDNHSDESHSSLLSADMELESEEPPSAQVSFNVKEAFKRLLRKSKNIHNKILTYEPLPLETLCEELKNEGCKGKISDIISFLDDECITFQTIEQNKNRQRKQRKRKNETKT